MDDEGSALPDNGSRQPRLGTIRHAPLGLRTRHAPLVQRQAVGLVAPRAPLPVAGAPGPRAPLASPAPPALVLRMPSAGTGPWPEPPSEDPAAMGAGTAARAAVATPTAAAGATPSRPAMTGPVKALPIGAPALPVVQRAPLTRAPMARPTGAPPRQGVPAHDRGAPPRAATPPSSSLEPGGAGASASAPIEPSRDQPAPPFIRPPLPPTLTDVAQRTPLGAARPAPTPGRRAPDAAAVQREPDAEAPIDAASDTPAAAPPPTRLPLPPTLSDAVLRAPLGAARPAAATRTPLVQARREPEAMPARPVHRDTAPARDAVRPAPDITPPEAPTGDEQAVAARPTGRAAAVLQPTRMPPAPTLAGAARPSLGHRARGAAPRSDAIPMDAGQPAEVRQPMDAARPAESARTDADRPTDAPTDARIDAPSGARDSDVSRAGLPHLVTSLAPRSRLRLQRQPLRRQADASGPGRRPADAPDGAPARPAALRATIQARRADAGEADAMAPPPTDTWRRAALDETTPATHAASHAGAASAAGARGGADVPGPAPEPLALPTPVRPALGAPGVAQRAAGERAAEAGGAAPPRPDRPAAGPTPTHGGRDLGAAAATLDGPSTSGVVQTWSDAVSHGVLPGAGPAPTYAVSATAPLFEWPGQAIQATPAEAAPAPRAVDADGSAAPGAAAARAGADDVERLARQVYGLIRRRLQIERERSGAIAW